MLRRKEKKYKIKEENKITSTYSDVKFQNLVGEPHFITKTLSDLNSFETSQNIQLTLISNWVGNFHNYEDCFQFSRVSI